MDIYFLSAAYAERVNAVVTGRLLERHRPDWTSRDSLVFHHRKRPLLPKSLLNIMARHALFRCLAEDNVASHVFLVTGAASHLLVRAGQRE